MRLRKDHTRSNSCNWSCVVAKWRVILMSDATARLTLQRQGGFKELGGVFVHDPAEFGRHRSGLMKIEFALTPMSESR
jgi:hypothetical protein